MAMSKQSLAPAGFVPEMALCFTDSSGAAVPSSLSSPMPVAVTPVAATSVPIAGTTSANLLAGPFLPQLGRPIWVTLSGTWSGSVVVERSVDGGATRLPLTIGGLPWGRFTANAHEPVSEESVASAVYYLDIAISSGTLAYGMQQ